MRRLLLILLLLCTFKVNASWVTNGFAPSVGLKSKDINVNFNPVQTPFLATNGQIIYSVQVGAKATNGILAPTWLVGGLYTCTFGPVPDTITILCPIDTNTYSLWQLWQFAVTNVPAITNFHGIIVQVTNQDGTIKVTNSTGPIVYIGGAASGGGSGIPTLNGNGTNTTLTNSLLQNPILSGTMTGSTGSSIAVSTVSNVLIQEFSNHIIMNYLTDQVWLDFFHLTSTNSGTETADLEFDNGTLYLAGTETIGASGNLDLLQLTGLGVLYVDGSKVTQELPYTGTNTDYLDATGHFSHVSSGSTAAFSKQFASYNGTTNIDAGATVTNLVHFSSGNGGSLTFTYVGTQPTNMITFTNTHGDIVGYMTTNGDFFAHTVTASQGIFGNLSGATNLSYTNLSYVTVTNRLVAPLNFVNGLGTTTGGDALLTNWNVSFSTNRQWSLVTNSFCISNCVGLISNQWNYVELYIFTTNAANSVPVYFSVAGLATPIGFNNGIELPQQQSGLITVTNYTIITGRIFSTNWNDSTAIWTFNTPGNNATYSSPSGTQTVGSTGMSNTLDEVIYSANGVVRIINATSVGSIIRFYLNGNSSGNIVAQLSDQESQSPNKAFRLNNAYLDMFLHGITNALFITSQGSITASNNFIAGPNAGLTNANGWGIDSNGVATLSAINSPLVNTTVVWSNIPPLIYYTNNSGSVQIYTVGITNQIAAVAGASTYTFAISNANSGGWSNTVIGMNSLITSISMLYSNHVTIVLNTNAVLAMTNTSSGVGNIAGESFNTGQITTIGNATASGVPSLGGNNVFTGNQTYSFPNGSNVVVSQSGIAVNGGSYTGNAANLTNAQIPIFGGLSSWTVTSTTRFATPTIAFNGAPNLLVTNGSAFLPGVNFFNTLHINQGGSTFTVGSNVVMTLFTNGNGTGPMAASALSATFGNLPSSSPSGVWLTNAWISLQTTMSGAGSFALPQPINWSLASQ